MYVVCLFWRLSPCGCIVCRDFSHSVGCLFILFMVSLAVQKLLSLIRNIGLFLFLFSLFYEVDQTRYSRDLCQRAFSLFYSRGFIVSGLMFQSLIHFELIFVYNVKMF